MTLVVCFKAGFFILTYFLSRCHLLYGLLRCFVRRSCVVNKTKKKIINVKPDLFCNVLRSLFLFKENV